MKNLPLQIWRRSDEELTYEDLEEELPALHEDLMVLHEEGEECVVVPVCR